MGYYRAARGWLLDAEPSRMRLLDSGMVPDE
jgi:hypothetical protein